MSDMKFLSTKIGISSYNYPPNFRSLNYPNTPWDRHLPHLKPVRVYSCNGGEQISVQLHGPVDRVTVTTDAHYTTAAAA